jgi:hypothetical protein
MLLLLCDHDVAEELDPSKFPGLEQEELSSILKLG